MEIIRDGVTYYLTADELYQAYKEQERLYKIEDMKFWLDEMIQSEKIIQENNYTLLLGNITSKRVFDCIHEEIEDSSNLDDIVLSNDMDFYWDNVEQVLFPCISEIVGYSEFFGSKPVQVSEFEDFFVNPNCYVPKEWRKKFKKDWYNRQKAKDITE